jgi:diguanylate cyclase (GGDEF)-like protein
MLQEHAIWLTRGVIQKINSTFNLQQLAETLLSYSYLLRMKRCYLCMYASPAKRKKNGSWLLGEYSNLIMGYDETGVSLTARDSIMFPTRQILPAKLIQDEERHSLVVQALFLREDHFGYIVFDLIRDNDYIYETFREQISVAIQRVLLLSEKTTAEVKLKSTLVELEKYNEELHNLSLKDEVTGLYNERGFFLLGDQHYRLSCRDRRKFLVVNAVLEGLESIRQTHGREEGDEAVRSLARILNGAFGQADIVGRLGEDRFSVIATDGRPEDSGLLRKKLTAKLEEHNAGSRKPYPVKVHLGFTLFDPENPSYGGNPPGLDRIVNAADDLPAEKKKRKSKKGD